jgi:hypothetical protein
MDSLIERMINIMKNKKLTDFKALTDSELCEVNGGTFSQGVKAAHAVKNVIGGIGVVKLGYEVLQWLAQRE